MTPAFVTLYGPIIGAAIKPAADATLRMNPRFWRFIAGTAKWQPWMTPSKFTSISKRQSSSGISPTAPATATPALFTIRSRPPQRSIAPSTSAFMSSGLRTSVRVATTAPEGASLAVSSAAARFRSLARTVAPREASSSVMARPKPLPAPVTTARAFWGSLRMAALV